MSNFEKEYRKYAQDSTPDLWSRIEAGVDALEEKRAEDIDGAVANKTTDHDNEKSSNGLHKVTFFRRYGVWIGAAACLVIIMPAVILLSKMGPSMKSAEADMAVADSAAADAMDVSEAVPAGAASDIAENGMNVEEAAEMYEESAATAAKEVCDESPAEAVEDAEMYSEAATKDNIDVKAPATSTKNQNSNSKRNAVNTFAAVKNDFKVNALWENDSEYASDIAEVIDDEEYSEWVQFKFDATVSDFEVLKINIIDVDKEGNVIYDSESVYSMKSIRDGSYVSFKLSFPGDMPTTAISFKDEKGVKRVIAVSVSGKDGSIVLSKI